MIYTLIFSNIGDMKTCSSFSFDIMYFKPDPAEEGHF